VGTRQPPRIGLALILLSLACSQDTHAQLASELNDGYVVPRVALVCNFGAEPTAQRPSLLTHHDVETLFHEFGHTLATVLSRTGTRSTASASLSGGRALMRCRMLSRAREQSSSMWRARERRWTLWRRHRP
jgi:hypothetical protein